MRALSNLAAAATLAATAACGSMPREAAPENRNLVNSQQVTPPLIFVHGGPLTQGCDVSPIDKPAMAIAGTGEPIDLFDSEQTQGFFTCEPGSRMETDETGRTACLEDTMSNVAEMAINCVNASIQPIVNCNPDTAKKTVEWKCYDGPVNMPEFQPPEPQQA